MHLLSETWKKKSWDLFEKLGAPQRKSEAFQYVRFGETVTPEAAQETPVERSGSNTIVFSNGFFQFASLPAGVICLPLSQAMQTYGLFLQNRFSKMLLEETDPLAALNGAFHEKGAFLYIPPLKKLEETIEIEHWFSSSLATYPRLHIYLGKGASLKLSQKIVAPEQDLFCNGYFDIALDEGASFQLCKVGAFSKQTTFLESLRVSLKKGSHFVSTSSEKGGALYRSSYRLTLLEEESEALLQGISQLKGDEQHHRHITIHHAAPSCKSRQYFKGVLKDQSISSFEGKIIVDPIAQKTESYQLSKNLVLSDEASVFTKPNLEIGADDVKASHGATIAQLSEAELFYLRSRGIALEAAKKLLIDAFCAEIEGALPNA
jgi:Fe-S cluster assembly protein SufD